VKNYHKLHKIINQKILVLDGAMGTMIQSYQFKENDYRGQLFRKHPIDLKGNSDVLNLTQSDAIKAIHRAYLDAGADIIETNTFNGTEISQREYGLQHKVNEMNFRGAQLARQALDQYLIEFPSEQKFVCGSMGPTSTTASLSPDVMRPAHRTITFDELYDAYKNQAENLIKGGVDVLMVETIFDTLNAKAALMAIQDYKQENNINIPVMASVTVSDGSGRTLSGQTLEAFWTSIRHFDLFSVGLNCSFGVELLKPYLRTFNKLAETRISIHPNAGLPNIMGEYDDSPRYMAESIADFAQEGWVNIVGGCCGSTPKHISAIKKAVENLNPRPLPSKNHTSVLSGLERLFLDESSNFFNIGERTNIAGSSQFKKLLKNNDFEKASNVARQQIENGAQIIDINVDDDLLDGLTTMETLIRTFSSDPAVARVPFMIDSSNWEIIECALKNIQGKTIVNSISLKDGEEAFLEKARRAKKFGAAVVVMAFDEKGQADTYEKRVAICKRAYELLVNQINFLAEDIIFDVNVFAIATGIPEHDHYAKDFIETVRTLKALFPLVHFSGGISNLSFSFRQNPPIRKAMHSIFLYHAIQAGLDMGIVNPGQLWIYDKIPNDMKIIIENVVLGKSKTPAEDLIALANGQMDIQADKIDAAVWKNLDLEERIHYQLVEGLSDQIENDALAAYEKLKSALAVIEGPLMSGMNQVGDLFGSGKMFLPQVVKSARVMKKAVAVLEPFMLDGDDENANKPVIVMATVKGDVHDIGKNIVSVVLSANGFAIHDLGVMTSLDSILKAIQNPNVVALGLSGLITPSLFEMIDVAKELEKIGSKMPLLIGGATTSKTHTAVRIDKEYSGLVVHVKDASRAIPVLQSIQTKSQYDDYLRSTKSTYHRLRHQYLNLEKQKVLATFNQIQNQKFNPVKAEDVSVPKNIGMQVWESIPLETLVDFIDWTPFFLSWNLKGKYPKILNHDEYGKEAQKIKMDADALIKELILKKLGGISAVVGIFPTQKSGDDVIIMAEHGQSELGIFHFLRQQEIRSTDQKYISLSDYLFDNDFIGFFTSTAGLGLEILISESQNSGDDYRVMMLKALGDRLAEAATEWLHYKVRTELWGFSPNESLSIDELILGKYQGSRPAVGYPSCPDHTEKELIWKLLDVKNNTGASLTSSYAMTPQATVSGWIFSHPKAQYFNLGKIGVDQFSDYAKRKNMPKDELTKWLAPHLIDNDS
jgi:5-methyltetrahydrofolate--homocysteine methyltransferase